MFYNSRMLAMALAFVISIALTFILSFLNDASTVFSFVVFGISFAITFIPAFFMLEFVIFKELTKLNNLAEKLHSKKNKQVPKDKSGKLNPIEKINEEIYSFAETKEKEIDKLKKLEAFRKEFIADVSHELKTPIFAAQGFLHTLLDGAMKDKSVRNKFLKKAAKSLDGLDALVQDLVTLSQIETGQIKMHFKPVDMFRVAEDVFEQLEEKAAKRKISLRVKGAPNKILVKADRQRIFQVMTNLVSNALKHSHEEEEIVVSFDVTDDYVTTHVRDFGIGIPPEHLPRIFERFYRVDKSRSRERGGTGLGLAIVKHILENHNSKAEVTSEPDKGSDFSFKLPRIKPDNAESKN